MMTDKIEHLDDDFTISGGFGLVYDEAALQQPAETELFWEFSPPTAIDGKPPAEDNSDDDSDGISVPPLDIHDDNAFKVLPDIKPEDVESELTEKIKKLQMSDQEQIYNDMYGVAGELQETQESIRASLDQFEKEVDKLEHVPAYDLACLLGPEYVKNESFRLRFLRADSHNAKRAAQRFTYHFKVKLDLFGHDLLVKDITQDDLEEKPLEGLYNGFSQFFPSRDRAGRMVHVSFVPPADLDFVNKLKMDFYLGMVLSEDVDTQLNGAVGIRYFCDQGVQGKSETPVDHWQAQKIFAAMPIRACGMHYCHDSKSLWSPFIAAMKSNLNFFFRSRTREHHGTREQCLFYLQTFGIPTHNFPLSPDGTISTEYNREFWTKRRNLEHARKQKSKERNNSDEQHGNETKTVTPDLEEPEPISTTRQTDVLLGRGKRYYEHLGNVRLRYLVESLAVTYNNAKNTAEKKTITSQVVSLVHQSGGRFLKDKSGAGWIEVDDEAARLKVSHIFRNLRLRTSAPQQNQDPTLKRALTDDVADAVPSNKR